MLSSKVLCPSPEESRGLEEVWGSSWAYSGWDRGWMWVRTSLAGVWNSPRVLVEASCMMLAMKRKPDRLMALPLASVVSMATMLVEAGSPWYTASFCCSRHDCNESGGRGQQSSWTSSSLLLLSASLSCGSLPATGQVRTCQDCVHCTGTVLQLAIY
mgnify:CR=1 FL=1